MAESTKKCNQNINQISSNTIWIEEVPSGLQTAMPSASGILLEETLVHQELPKHWSTEDKGKPQWRENCLGKAVDYFYHKTHSLDTVHSAAVWPHTILAPMAFSLSFPPLIPVQMFRERAWRSDANHHFQVTAPKFVCFVLMVGEGR